MKYLLFIVTGVVAYLLGAFGWAQIIGSLQNVKTRGAGMTLFTVIFWAAILVGSYFLMKAVVPGEKIAYFLGLAISLVLVLRSGKIQ
jgi:hypothetical protein